MNLMKFLASIVGISLILMMTGCESATNTNSNVAVSNANLATNVNANTNRTDNQRVFNANITREEFEKDKQAFTMRSSVLAENSGRAPMMVGFGPRPGRS